MRNCLLPLLTAACLFSMADRLQAQDLNVVPLYDVEEIAGPGATSLASERWTGLGQQSDPAAMGDLTTGLRPWSMSGNHLFRKLSGTGYQAENSIYANSNPQTQGVIVPSGEDPMAAKNEILQGKVSQTRADQLLSLGYELDNPGVFSASSLFDIPIIGADTVVFQLNITGFGPSALDVTNGTYITSYQLTQLFTPVTLSINGLAPITGQAQLLSYSDTFQSLSHAAQLKDFGLVSYEAEEVWAFTFDISAFTDPIHQLEIQFINYPHSSIRGLQTDVIATIPEPSTYLLIGCGLLLVMVLRKRRASPRTA